MIRSVSRLLLAGAASIAMLGASTAADVALTLPEPDEVVSDWSGFYAGGSVGYYVSGYANLDGIAGVNFLPTENFLLGVEVGGGPVFDVGGGAGNGWEVYFAGRAGYASDDFLVYGIAGLEAYSWGGTSFFGGIGAEVAVADQLSLRAQGVIYPAGDANVSAGL